VSNLERRRSSIGPREASVAVNWCGTYNQPAFAMVAPMLRHAYTDAAAAHKALIAAQFATALQLVWRAIWQFLDAILLAVSWRGIGWLLQDHLRVSRLQLVMAAPAAEPLPVDAEDHKRIGPRWLRLRG
jgi:hypothetical protein